MRSAGGAARLVAAAALVLGFLLVAPATASAHDELTGSDPQDGVTLAELPAEIRLTFNNPPIALGSQANLTLPGGEQVPATDLQIVDSVVAIPVPPDAGPGDYDLDWRVVSSDGHPIDGQLAFTVEAAAEPTGSAEPSTDQVTTEATTEETDGATGGATSAAPPEDAATTDSGVGTDAEATSAETEAGGFPVLPVVLGVITLIGVTVLVLRSRGGETGPSGDPGDPPTP